MRSFAFVAVILPIVAGGPASAADVVSPTVVSAPSATGFDCSGSYALSRVKHNFAWAERHLWHRGFAIQQIGNPRPSGHFFAEPGLVQRDYCMADAVMTDGSEHPVYYVIEHGLGFVGIGSDIDSCVPGLDPWHVHDGDCRTVR